MLWFVVAYDMEATKDLWHQLMIHWKIIGSLQIIINIKP